MSDGTEIEIDLNAPDNDKKSDKGTETDKKATEQQPDAAAVAAEASAQAAPQPEIPPEEGIADLKAKLEESERARKAAEAAAKEAEQRSREARVHVGQRNIDLVNAGIERCKVDENRLKAEYAAALSIGDHEKAADIQTQIARNAAVMLNLEGGKQRLEAEAQAVTVDPVEHLARQLSPRSADWVRRHPTFATGSEFNRMLAAHNLAIAEGHAPDSDEYFNAVETTLKLRQPERTAETVRAENNAGNGAVSEAATPVQQRSSAPPAAPVSRGGNGTGSTRPGVVRLTAEEREIAASLGMTDKEYAQNKQKLLDEKRLSVH